MKNIAIRVENLSKQYRIGRAQQRHDTLRDALMGGLRAPVKRLSSMVRRPSAGADDGRRTADDKIWALKDVSFEVERGEVVGIIGRNGAGKSTLLKILSRITEPTEGRAEIHGRVGSLLEVGTGFHPELTGRENIYLSGAILGMRRDEIERKFDEIVAFSGVEKFIDTPIKRYSSGMYVRLAFAVAAHLESEVLLVDEVLAVGDHQFRKKCLGKMEDVARGGRTVLFVSHNIAAVRALCPTAFCLERGRILLKGDTDTVIERYLGSLTSDSTGLAERQHRAGSGEMRLTDIRLLSETHQPVDCWPTGHGGLIEVEFENELRRQHSVVIMLTIYDQLGAALCHLNNELTGNVILSAPGKNAVVCSISELCLQPGRYRLNAAIRSNDRILDHIAGCLTFEVVPDDYFHSGRLPNPGSGSWLVPHSWAQR
jgi:lipopolysaccharide transport system ATP-binding protein